MTLPRSKGRSQETYGERARYDLAKRDGRAF